MPAIMLRRAIGLIVLWAVCCGIGAAAPEQWLEARSEHFRLVTNAGDKQARHILDQFERMRWMFQTLFPKANVDPVEPIVVIAAKNSKTFQALEPADYLGAGQLKLAGLFMSSPDKNYVLLRLDAEFSHPFASVYHEYTHLQFKSAGEWMPLWLNEGLAEFFQNTDIRNKDVWLGEPSADDLLYLRQNRLIPLPVLFKVDKDSPYYHQEQKGSVFYSESWALTHMLQVTDRERGTHRTYDYVNFVSQHVDPLEAAGKAFGDLKKLQDELENYIRGANYKQFLLSSAAAPIDESSYKVRTISQTEADAIRGDVLVGVQRESDARGLLESVLKADPDNAVAHEAMGDLEFRAGNHSAAQKWYGEAVKLSSDNYFAYFNFANLSLSEGKGWDDPEIERSLRTAVKLNPRFYPASEFLATLLSSQSREADAMAVMQDAAKNAASPLDAAKAKRKIAQIEQMQEARKRAPPAADVTAAASATLVDVVEAPKYPTIPADGPKHEILGMIRDVKCSSPAVIEFRVEGAKASVSLYNNNYYKLEFSALGFTPEGALQPCSDIEGMKARVQYVESSDKTVDGQVLSIELRKSDAAK
jgi:tetratricopeptide (TPR) repeat protein